MNQPTWETVERLLATKGEDAQRKEIVRAWGHISDIQEISAGAIIPTDLYGEYQIQAATAAGLRNFRAVESSDADPQSDVEESPAVSFLDSVAVLSLAGWKSVTIKGALLNKAGQTKPVLTEPPSKEHGKRARPNVQGTPADVLRRLGSTTTSVREMRKAVLDAEIMPFDGAERTEICSLLRDFVMRNRDSNVPEDLVAVCAAIRKLVAYLPTENLGSLGDLLRPGERISVPLEIELEVAKTVLWKLTARPPLSDDSEPELADRLFEVADTYLNPRLLAREKHGATALNAALSLMLLRSRHAAEVHGLIKQASAKWFATLACRRVCRLLADLRNRIPDPAFAAVSRSLMEFSKCFCDEN